MGRFKHIHLALIVGISLFIPFFLAYSLYVDLSGTLLLSSDMSFEDPEDEDLSTCQNEFKIFVPQVSSNPYTYWGFGREPNLISSQLNFMVQNKPVLRC